MKFSDNLPVGHRTPDRSQNARNGGNAPSRKDKRCVMGIGEGGSGIILMKHRSGRLEWPLELHRRRRVDERSGTIPVEYLSWHGVDERVVGSGQHDPNLVEVQVVMVRSVGNSLVELRVGWACSRGISVDRATSTTVGYSCSASVRV